MAGEGDVREVRRKPARSGKVDYSEPVTIHQTSQSKVDLLPFFIPHTDRTGLSVKFVVSRQLAGAFIEDEDGSLSLSEESTTKLFEWLTANVAVARENADGDYLLVRLTEGTADLGERDPTAVAAALTKLLSSPALLERVAEPEVREHLDTALRRAFRLSDMRSAVEALRKLLESGEASEALYQDWCDEHSWAFGNAYVVRDDISAISRGDRVDILLPRVISGYRDIVELKRPDQAILGYDSKRRHHYLLTDVSKAIGQCHRYLDVLHEEALSGLRDYPEIVAYHPRATIVIGRSNDWSKEEVRALHGLNSRMVGISVMTYDQLLAQGERLLEMLDAADDD